MSSRIRQFLHDERLQLIVLLIPLVAAFLALPYATEAVPMQWNARGQVNWYAPKEWGLLVVPLTMLLIFAIVFWRESKDSGRVQPEEGGLSSHGKATRSIRLILSVVMAVVCFVQIAYALGRHPDMGRWATAAGPLMLALTGNFFGKLKPNRYVGIRVPWTLRSETVWRRTHRIAGWLYTLVGLVAGALSLIVPDSYLMEILIIWLAIIVLVPFGMAWAAAREEKAGGESKGLSLGWMALIEAVVLAGIGILYFQVVVADPAHEPQRKAAQAAAEIWIRDVDEGHYAEAWQATGSVFRKAVSQKAQIAAWNKYRKPSGPVARRTLREATYTESLPRAARGKYVLVRFNTTFENHSNAIETIVEQLETDGQWRVTGYWIK